MSRYTLLGDTVKPQTAFNTGSAISWLIVTVLACIAIGYAFTVYNAQPTLSLRIDVLSYNLTNETNVRLAKDIVLMWNVSQLSMDVSFLYAALNMTNNTGVQLVQTIIYLNSSVTNNTNDINYIYSLLNVTNTTGNTVINNIVYLNQSVTYITNEITNIYGILNTTVTNITNLSTDLSTLNQTVNSIFYNVTLLQMFSITNITVGPGLSTNIGNPAQSGGYIDVNNPYVQLQVLGSAMSGTYASVTADQYGRVTSIVSGTAPVTSVAQGTGISITGGVLNGGNSMGTISLATTGTAGTYIYPSQVVTDAYGRVTSVTNGTIGVLGVTSVTAGTGLSGGVITTTGTISMPNVGTNGTYNNPSQIITDAQGRVTSLTSGVTPISSISAGTGMSFNTINSTNPSGSVSLSNVGTAGTYSNPSQITTDGQGRVTSVTSGTTVVTSITAGAGLSGGTITTSGTISMTATYPPSGVTNTRGLFIMGFNQFGQINNYQNLGQTFIRMWPDSGFPSSPFISFATSQVNQDCNGRLTPCYQGFNMPSITTFTALSGSEGRYLFQYKMFGMDTGSSTGQPNGLVIILNIPCSPGPYCAYFIGYSSCVVVNGIGGGFCEASASFTDDVPVGTLISLFTMGNVQWINTQYSGTPPSYSGPPPIGAGLYAYFAANKY